MLLEKKIIVLVLRPPWPVLVLVIERRVGHSITIMSTASLSTSTRTNAVAPRLRHSSLPSKL